MTRSPYAQGRLEVLVHLLGVDCLSPKGHWGCLASRTKAGGSMGRSCGCELNGPGKKKHIKLENYGET